MNKKTKVIGLLTIIAVLALLVAAVSADNGSRLSVIAEKSVDAGELIPASHRQVEVTVLDGFEKSGRYIVQLEDPALALYRGGIPGLRAPESTEGRLNVNSSASLAYVSYLDSQQAALVNDVSQTLGRTVEPVTQYRYSINGLVLEISDQEAQAIAGLPGIKSIEPDYIAHLDTDAGPAWIGAEAIWDGDNTSPSRGEGVVVGILDSGINQDHPSFAAEDGEGYVHTNPNGAGVYVGVCDPANTDIYDSTFACNDKLIGAWDFADEYGEPGGADGPRDNDGHGSHTASTTAGNVVSARLFAPTAQITRTISGVAPRANIIAYDVCTGGSCPTAAVIDAIEQSIVDGVDVLNESIGISGDTFSGSKQQAYLGAFAAGIVASRSAGNSGPGPATTGPEPVWTMSSGASTHNRQLVNAVVNIGFNTDGSDQAIANISGLGFTSGYGPAKIVYAGDYPSELTNTPNLCGVGGEGDFTPPWPEDTFDGEIVVCDRGTFGRVEKGANVLEAGAGGYILVDNGGGLVGDAHALPGVHISQADGEVLKDWLDPNVDQFASIAGVTVSLDPANGDVMAGFSSRGPAPVDVIKPDITSPGVSILAAVNADDPNTPDGFPEYGFLGGTSMASPHTAGAAALLVSLHPDWTPAQIRSALMSTAFNGDTVVKEDGFTPVDPFDVGGGRTAVNAAALAGLVLDETAENFDDADPALGGDPSTLNLASMASAECYQGCSWTRTVSSTVPYTVTWTAMVEEDAGLDLLVEPASFEIGPYATATFTLTADVTRAMPESWVFGAVDWMPSEALPNTRFPVAAYVASSTDSNTVMKMADVAYAYVGDNIEYTIDVTNQTPNTNNFLAIDTLPGGVAYVPNSASASLGNFNFFGDTILWNGVLGGSSVNIAPTTLGFGYLPLSNYFGPAPCSSSCDETILNISGVDFYYLGEHYTSIAAVSNGYAIPGGGSTADVDYINQNMPDSNVPNNVLAPMWTDIDLDGTAPDDAGGGTWYYGSLSDGVNDYFILEWTDAQQYGLPEATYTFQIWIVLGTDIIWYEYADLTGLSLYEFATVGAEDSTGTAGVSYYYDGAGTAPEVGVPLRVSGVAGETAEISFEVEILTNSTVTDILNEVRVNDGVTTNTAWANTVVTTTARLQAVHLAPFASGSAAVDLYLNDTTGDLVDIVVEDFGFAQSTGYVVLPAGEYEVEIKLAGTDTTAIGPATVNLAAGSDYTAIATGGANGYAPDLVVLEDNVHTTGNPSTDGFVRIGHYAPFDATLANTEVDIYNDDTATAILSNVPFGIESGYLALPEGTYDLSVWSSADGTLLFDLGPIDVEAGTYTAALAAGDGENQMPDVYGVLDGGTTGDLPSLTIDLPQLQVVHLAPFAAGDALADIYLDGTAVLTDVAYATSSGYLPNIQPGDYLAEVKPAGTTTTAVSATISIELASQNTVIAFGGANGYPLELVQLLDNVPPTSRSVDGGPVGFVRIGHLAPFAPVLADTAVDVVSDADGSVILSNVPYGAITGYLPLEVGTYDLRILLSATGSTLFDLAPVAVTENSYVSAFAAGDGTNQAPNVYAVTGAGGELPSLVIYKLYLPIVFKAE